MKARESKFSISRAPSSRARCRACKGVIEKGDVRIMTLAAVSSWPMPWRSQCRLRDMRGARDSGLCSNRDESARGGGEGAGGRGVDDRGAGACEREKVTL